MKAQPDHAGSAHVLSRHLDKAPADFTRSDLISFIKDNQVKLLNFRYPGEDNRLKTLQFVINNNRHLDSLLASGERVDGSSLFSFMEPGSSDLYVVPRYRTAFLNPFSAVPALDLFCSFFTPEGEPLPASPETILHKAAKVLRDRTGYDFYAMGELEYYVISPRSELYRTTDQRGYHESKPFSKWEDLRSRALYLIAQCGGLPKYAHGEVGNFSIGDTDYEQNEIEFLPVPAAEAAEQLLLAKWMLRNLAWQQGVTVSFAPKITAGKAGSGMHIHTQLMKEGRNVMTENGSLGDAARRMIAGFLWMAPSLTAFGNSNPSSYFRLVPNQEAPTRICWGDRNRSVLVRVPLGWTGHTDMTGKVNPQQPVTEISDEGRQTVEFRSPDGSADVYLLLAGLMVAARFGLETEEALEFAASKYVDTDIFSEESRERTGKLQSLPLSCWESAEALQKHLEIYKQYGVFSDTLLYGLVKKLKNFNDRELRNELKDNEQGLLALVKEHFHCG